MAATVALGGSYAAPAGDSFIDQKGELMNGEFSVYQYCGEEQIQIDEVRWVDHEVACETFARLCTNVAAQTGFTKRVIITDGGDCVNMEWKFDEGVTYPPELKNLDLSRRKNS
jgi:hypothetical protein